MKQKNASELRLPGLPSYNYVAGCMAQAKMLSEGPETHIVPTVQCYPTNTQRVCFA